MGLRIALLVAGLSATTCFLLVGPASVGSARSDGVAPVQADGTNSSPIPTEAGPSSIGSPEATHPIVGSVTFPHEEHAEDLEIPCNDCHHEVNATRLSTPHDEYFEDFWINCRACHNGTTAGASGPAACSDCHAPHPGGKRDLMPSAKVVVHQLCWSCHEAGTGLQASESCPQCHTGMEGRP